MKHFLHACLLLGLILLDPSTGWSQWSLSAGYQTADAPYWDLLGPNYAPLLDHGFTSGIQYEIGGPESIISLLPALGYGRIGARHNLPNRRAHSLADIFQVRTEVRFYPVQLLCECPDFGDRVFIHTELGWNQLALTHQAPDLHLFEVTSSWSAGLGGGIVLRFSDWMQVSPVFRFFFFDEVNWSGLETLVNQHTDPLFRSSTTLRGSTFEIRASIFW